MLRVTDLKAAYGASPVLFGVSLDVRAGEVVTVLGRNGMGKTTTLHAIMGIVRATGGQVVYNETDLVNLPTYQIARCGIGLVPEGRQVFPNLTVSENLVATATNRKQVREPWTLDRIFEMFPELAARKSSMGNLLSGGEQQMLAIARALMTNPQLLILDEATEGLAPLIRREIWACLRRIREEGVAILIVDKNVGDLMGLAERHHILEKGRVVWSGASDKLRASKDIRKKYLGV
ncbi:MAG: ABC transporter ATP-binding protein [Hyphomicrobiaceae bacterium]